MWHLNPLVIEVIEEIENLWSARVRAYARENEYCYGMWIVVVKSDNSCGKVLTKAIVILS